MNKFRTEVEPGSFDFSISYKSKSLFLGSCFTNHIGGKMQDLKFNARWNPLGIAYNPVSVKRGLELLLEGYVFKEEDLGFNKGLWYSFYHHSDFSDPDRDKCLEGINSRAKEAAGFLKDTDFLFLSFGTARVYELKESSVSEGELTGKLTGKVRGRQGQIVSNCHKLPAKLFNHKMLGTAEIEEELSGLFEKLSRSYPKLKIVLTLSPIRHWKDGAEGNQMSKATLLLAIHKLVERFGNVSYFPSYEIMMDDLRDYRFYAEDMLHISDVAVDYIWGKFKNAFLDKEALRLIPAIEKILKAVRHRPFNPDSAEHKDFIKNTLKKIEEIEKKHPYIELSKEKLQMIRQL